MKTELKFFINRNPIYAKCTSCNETGTLQKSRARTTTERLVKTFTFLKIYRCKTCGWRGYRSLFIITSRSILALGYYIGIILFVAYIVNKILNNYNN